MRFRDATLLLLIGTSLLACTSSTPEEDTGLDSLAISADACDRNRVLRSAPADRKQILSRAFQWLDARVPYSTTRTRDGYRTDCSGFVSMCWQLGTSNTTAGFMGGASPEFSRLSSYNELLPGDALVYRKNGSGHAVVFAGWSDASQRSACVIHAAGTSHGMRFHAWSSANLRQAGYVPLRSSKASSGEEECGETDGCDLPVPPIPPPPPPGNDKGGGMKCTLGGELCISHADCCSFVCGFDGVCIDD